MTALECDATALMTESTSARPDHADGRHRANISERFIKAPLKTTVVFTETQSIVSGSLRDYNQNAGSLSWHPSLREPPFRP